MKFAVANIREDIKTLFDFIRNLALCAAMLLSIPTIDEAFPLVGGSEIPKQTLLFFVFGLFIAFYLYNIVWLLLSLRAASSFKWKWVSYLSASILVSTHTLVLVGYGLAEIWPVLMNAQVK